MPLGNIYQAGSIYQIGQGINGPGERHGWSNTLNAHAAASIAFNRSITKFERPSSYFNRLNPLFYGPSSVLDSDVPPPGLQQQAFIQQVFGYRTQYWQGISGLHPGDGGYGTSIVRSLTGFGSGLNIEKVLNWDNYSSKIATEQREYIQNVLGKVPGANIIAFDVETTGLKTPLESYTSGAPTARMTEFAVTGGRAPTLHGFTEQASMKDLINLSLESSLFAKEYGAAARRYGKYQGESYKASGVLEAITSRIVPGQTNILTGHNLGAFDLKFLSAELAMERGYVSPAHIAQLSSYRPRTKEWWASLDIVNTGWERAGQDIRNAIYSKDKNIMIVDTLGGFKRGTFPRVFGDMRGITSSYMGGFMPAVSSFWAEHFGKTIKDQDILAQQVKFASAKGTGLASIMEHVGIPFKGSEHDPIADVEATAAFLRSPQLSRRVETLSADIAAGRKGPLVREARGFIGRQINQQQAVLEAKYQPQGKMQLAEAMVSAAGGQKPIIPAKTMNEAFSRLSLGQKVGIGAAAAAVTYAAYRMIFAPSRTEKIDGLHPGRNRPDYMIGSGFGSGRIWSEIMGMAAAMRAKSGELFAGESHGHAMMKLKKAGASFYPVRESYGFRMADKSFISREEAEKRFGIRTSEQLRVLQATGEIKSTADALQILVDNNNKLQGMHPGNSGYGTSIIRDMTDFGSGWKAFKAFTKKIGRELGLIGEESAPEKIMKIHNFTQEELSSLSRNWVTEKQVWKFMLRNPDDMEYRGPRRRISDMPTHGLTNHVLHDSAIGHTSYGGKSL